MDALVALLTLKLKTEIGAADASRLEEAGVGPKQDDPAGVDIRIHENSLDSPESWPHRPVRYRTPRPMGGFIGSSEYEGMQRELRTMTGYELVGGGGQMAFAFTAELEVRGEEIADIKPGRRDVGQLMGIVSMRLRKALQDAGPKIGTGDLISDDFGNVTQRGPFFGRAWIDYPEGEGLMARMMIRFYYICTVSWNTDEW
jgi:hypothetical protein